ncbi:rod shape-determining protein MreD [Hathewaya massiliensis]|uniref:rod shape-determining protein MreD n=1 Tax=Hathewaya massiliensis TaxID=1964382 RepID=UPI0011584F81|nr:rod shape-determining protein MreD [Hathewaya massiliensis]
MKKVFTVIGCALICLVLDNSLVPFLGVNGYYPSLLLVFVISYSILNDTKDAIILGSFSGLMQDVYFNGTLGVNAFSNLIVCLLASQIGRTIFKEKFLMPTLTNFVLSITKGVILLLLSFFIRETISLKSIIFISIYNFIIAIFMYRFLFKLSEKPFMKNYWKF